MAAFSSATRTMDQTGCGGRGDGCSLRPPITFPSVARACSHSVSGAGESGAQQRHGWHCRHNVGGGRQTEFPQKSASGPIIDNLIPVSLSLFPSLLFKGTDCILTEHCCGCCCQKHVVAYAFSPLNSSQDLNFSLSLCLPLSLSSLFPFLSFFKLLHRIPRSRTFLLLQNRMQSAAKNAWMCLCAQAEPLGHSSSARAFHDWSDVARAWDGSRASLSNKNKLHPLLGSHAQTNSCTYACTPSSCLRAC